MSGFFAILCVLALGAAGFCFVWFIGSSIVATRRKQHPKFISLLLCGLLIVLSGISFFSCALCIPPPYIPWSQVNVAYSEPKLSPTGDVAYFIKVVTQEKKGKALASSGPMDSYWTDVSRRLWSKSFLCRSKANGDDPEVVCQLTSGRVLSQFGIAETY